MADHDAGIGNERLQFRAHRFNRRHAVVQEKNLSAAVQFALDGVADQALVVGGRNRLDRQAVMRRRLDGAHVARAGQREIQRARNRRGAQGQHIHQRAQALELFLVQHAEPLFLVNHHQAQILERNVVLHNPVRADDDVHRAGRQAFHDLFLFARRAKPREQFDADGIIRHALAKIIEMLLGQHGRRHQDGHLFAVHHGLERGADGHFRFAKTHVAANQTVHRLGAFQIGLGLGDGGELVAGFLVNEGAFKFALPRACPA